MVVEPVELIGRTVRLSPLGVGDAAGLLRAAEPELFKFAVVEPPTWDVEGFRRYIQWALDMPDRRPFAVRMRESDEVVGTTSYLDIRPAHRGLEMGYTWIARAHQGTRVNPETKYLMLRHAFETLGAVRVQLKTDARNLHSQRAMEKLGCHREGVLRHHMILPDGFIRDSVMYSITNDEWPAVKSQLERRLGSVP